MDATAKPSSVAPAPPPAATTPALLTWTMPAQMALILLLTASLFFLLGRWSQERWLPSGTPPSGSAVARLDVNRATPAELRLVPGIGDSLAERIVADRQRHGGFATVDDLSRIVGVGPKTVAHLRSWLFVAAEDLVDTAAREPIVAMHTRLPGPTPGASRKVASLTTAIDINRAEIAELQKLPGIGPKLSQRIVDDRTLRGPFKTVEELRRVPGIGPKTLDRLRPLISVTPTSTLPTNPAPTHTAYNE